MNCLYEHPEWGRCQQRARSMNLCHYHHRMVTEEGFRADDFYHEKIVKGHLQPTEEYITRQEMETLFNGRARRDGRRTDAWVVE